MTGQSALGEPELAKVGKVGGFNGGISQLEQTCITLPYQLVGMEVGLGWRPEPGTTSASWLSVPSPGHIAPTRTLGVTLAMR